MKLNDFSLENFKNIQEIIKFTDQKAGFLLIVYGFILTAFLDYSKNLKLCNPSQCASSTEAFLSIATFAVGMAVISLIVYQFYLLIFGVLKPRQAKHYTNNEKSLFYFSHISKMDKDEFSEKITNLTDDEIVNILNKQVYEVSKIAELKSINFNRCILTLMPTVFALSVFCLLAK